MSKRGENIYKRKDGRWEGRYAKGYVGGKIKYGYVYGKTYKATKEKLSKYMDFNNSQKPINTKNRFSFIEISSKWLETAKPQLKQSSVIKYSNILENFLYPKFEGTSINCITCDDLINFSTELLTTGGTKGTGLSPKTVSTIISVLKSVFAYASRYEGISMPDFNCINIKQNPKPMRILSIDEQQRLTQYLCENQLLSNIGILICMYTGMRIGEVCALKWKDILLSEQCIFVEGTMQRLQSDNKEFAKTEVIITSPKSNSSIRTIPIPDNLYEILMKYKSSDEAYLLTGSNVRFLEPRTLQNHFKSALKICGINDANFHALRHTFATRCIEFGFDVKSLSEILGHASVNITLNKYVHPSMELKQKNMNMISDFLAVK